MIKKIETFLPRALYFGTAVFGAFHPHFGGFGIAVLRLVVIRHPRIAQTRGLKLLMWATVLMGNALTLICYILWVNFNMTESEAIFAECFEPSPNPNSSSLGRNCTLVLIFSAVIGEIICYLWIAYLIHKQDRLMVRHLSREVITKRHRRNAIDLIGKFKCLTSA